MQLNENQRILVGFATIAFVATFTFPPVLRGGAIAFEFLPGIFLTTADQPSFVPGFLLMEWLAIAFTTLGWALAISGSGTKTLAATSPDTRDAAAPKETRVAETARGR